VKAVFVSRRLCAFALFFLLFVFLVAGGCTKQKSQLAFSAPEKLPDGKVDMPYGYSFCQPELADANGICGKDAATKNPKGGSPPYSFTPGAMKSFPPVGIWLGMNGLLSGTPKAPGTYSFEVCAKDDAGEQICKQASLTILPNSPPPPPPPPPDKECTKGIQCATAFCKDGKCATCQADYECPNWGKCLFGACWHDAQCKQASDCSTGKCDKGKCVDCTKDSDCPGGYCDNYKVCKAREVEKCTNNSQCFTNVCKDGTCVLCKNDSDCGQRICSKFGFCEDKPECKVAADCKSNLCDNGVCRICINDSECAKGEYCDDFSCRKKVPSSATIGTGTCEITEQYTGDVRGVLRNMGAKYARSYFIRTSGTMEGPIGHIFYVTTSPTVGGPNSAFSCGSWETDPVKKSCTRRSKDMPTNSEWYYTTDAYGEQVNAGLNLQVTIKVEMTNSVGLTTFKTTRIAECPKVDY